MVLQDKEERYLAIEVNLNHKRVLLIGIYAPKGGKGLYFKEMTQNLEQMTHDQIILMGDFNRTVNAQIDRSPAKKKSNEGKLRKSFLKFG